jgi:hypothetical protein
VQAQPDQQVGDPHARASLASLGDVAERNGLA